MKIPFTKAHGARNDFLLTWRRQLPLEGAQASACVALARAICDRNTGVGADGWILLDTPSQPDPSAEPVSAEADGSIQLWNSDGSRSEISGNGTRCAAAVLVDEGKSNDSVRIATGAGVKHLELLHRQGLAFSFEMNMGAARIEELHSDVADGRDAVILNVGNPQCAVLLRDFDFDSRAFDWSAFDWRTIGAALERHPRFPNRTNVSFVRVVDRHTLDVRFFERGAGETMSSGTGSTGAAAAARARGLVDDPVRVLTPAGPLDLRWRGEEILLAGPAEIIARGEFYYQVTQD